MNGPRSRRALLPLSVALAAALALGACAGRPVAPHFWPPDAPVLPLLTGAVEEEPAAPVLQPRQYVVLLPDEDGTVGAIDVTRDGVTASLTEAYETVHFADLARAETTESAAVEGGFSPALTHEPPPPTRYIVYFDLGSTRLTEASDTDLSAALEGIGGRSAPEIILAGHADRSGEAENNKAISRERARAIEALLVEAGIPGDAIKVRWYGETAPAIPTDDGTREPGNRRVEIYVR